MRTYFLRRLLLMIPTFIGITFICFMMTRYVPGGPVEQAIMQYKAAAQGGGGGEVVKGGSGKEAGVISEEMINELKKIYGFDKPPLTAYVHWLWRILHFDLGESFKYSEPVWDVISRRFPISIFFGLTGFILSYCVCIPLGVLKAVHHNGKFDVTSSFMVFVGYSIPGWALGVVLLVLFGGGSYWNVFPLGGVHCSNWENWNLAEKIWDLAHHMYLPVCCYMVASFATLTVLMKNSLLENLGQDYVRTAFAKGLSEWDVILRHALRNSLIPLATGLGHALSIILAGSFLIERVFDINGMGLLGYTSLVGRDYPVTLGILVISSLLSLIGNLISDFIYVCVDPRIRFS